MVHFFYSLCLLFGSITNKRWRGKSSKLCPITVRQTTISLTVIHLQFKFDRNFCLASLRSWSSLKNFAHTTTVIFNLIVNTMSANEIRFPWNLFCDGKILSEMAVVRLTWCQPDTLYWLHHPKFQHSWLCTYHISLDSWGMGRWLHLFNYSSVP